MKKTLFIICLGLSSMLVFAGCNKTETVEEEPIVQEEVVEEVVETVSGVFGLGFGIDPRIGGDLDTIAVDFPYFPPVVDIILLDSYNSRFNVITDCALRKGKAPSRGEEEYGQ